MRVTATSRCARCASKRCTAHLPTAFRRSRSRWSSGTAPARYCSEHVSLGGVILFTRFIDMLFHPIVVLGEQTNILFRAMASGERIFQALDWDEKIHEPATPTPLPRAIARRGRISPRQLRLRPGRSRCCKRRVFRHPARRKTGDRWSHRLRQEHPDSPVGTVLRFRRRPDLSRRHRSESNPHARSAAPRWRRTAGFPHLLRHDLRQHRARRSGDFARACDRCGADGQRRRIHPRAAGWLRHDPVGTRPEPIAGSTAAARFRPRARRQTRKFWFSTKRPRVSTPKPNC